ncbi:MAG: TonB-dependent receptor plug domain-containing protein [Terriglobia bacterium]
MNGPHRLAPLAAPGNAGRLSRTAGKRMAGSKAGVIAILLKSLAVLLLMTAAAQNGPAESSQSDCKLWSLLTRHATCQGKKAQPDSNASKSKRSAKLPLASLSLAALGNVEVTTVSKEPEEVWRTPAAIYVITQDDIRRSGATTLPDALRLVPGAEVAQIDSDHWAVAIRGFNSQFSKYVLILIDGRNVYTPLQGGVYWEAQTVPLEDIDRIEVIRGPGGSIWGPNAVNGVINVITKSAKDTHGSLLTTGGGNVDRGMGEYRYGGSAGKSFDYRVYGMGFDRGPEFHLDHDPYDAWQTGQVGFRADWTPQSRDSLMIEGDVYKGDDGIRTSYPSYAPPSQNNVDGTEDLLGEDILGHWKREFKNGSDIQVRANFDRSNLLEPQLGEIRNTYDIDFLHHLSLPHRQDFLWGFGIDLKPGTIIQTVPTVDILPHHLKDSLYSGFVQDQIALVHNRLWLTVGSKIVHDNYTGFELEPSARLLWAPAPRKAVWASVTRSVSTPSDLDEGLQLTGLLATQPLPIYLRILGNSQFFSEQLTGYEAGYRSLLAPKLYLDVATFHNDYNYLESYGIGSPFFETSPLRLIIPFPYVNGVMGSTDGFEITPDWKPKRWWDLKGSYSYLNLNLRTRPGFVNAGFAVSDEGSSPQNEIVIQSLFNLPRRFDLDPAYRYVSALPALLIPAYGTADLHFGWRATQHLELSITGQNLLQPQHEEFTATSGLPVAIRRSAYGKVTLKW